jgi:DNA-binding LacI/PurR family transcriptional regulator
MLERRKTLRDVAKEANISVSTVSRVINNEKFISDDVRDRVNKAVKKFNYEPQWAARSLRTRKTNIIAIIISNIQDPWTAYVVRGIDEYFRDKNINIILFNSDRSPEREKELIRLALNKNIDGIILGTIAKDEKFIERIISEFSIPITIIDNKINIDNADFVLEDDVNGTYKLVTHLIKVHKLKKIAFIGGVLSESSGFDKFLGYKKALIENGIEIDENLVKEAFWDLELAYKATKELFSSDDKPEAIFCSNADIAIGSVRYLNEKKIKIPDDVAVVSFDDSEFIKAFNPPLTTLTGIEIKLGRKAAELLDLRMTRERKDNYEIIRVDSDVIIRKSCGCDNN